MGGRVECWCSSRGGWGVACTWRVARSWGVACAGAVAWWIRGWVGWAVVWVAWCVRGSVSGCEPSWLGRLRTSVARSRVAGGGVGREGTWCGSIVQGWCWPGVEGGGQELGRRGRRYVSCWGLRVARGVTRSHLRQQGIKFKWPRNRMDMNNLSVERRERRVVAVRRDAKGVRGGRGGDVA